MRILRALAIYLSLLIIPQVSSAQWVKTWSDSGWPYGPVSALLAVPGDSGNIRILAGTSEGIFYSNNDFTAWTEVDSGLPKNVNVGVYALAKDTTGPQEPILFAITNRGVFLSSNNAISWVPIDTNLVFRCLAVFPKGSGGSDIFAGGIGHRIYRSTDHGAAWTESDSGTYDCGDMVGIANAGPEIFALSEHRLWRSANNGLNWSGVDTTWFIAPCDGIDNANSCLAAVAHGIDSIDLFLGMTLGAGLFKSTNNGDSWSRINLASQYSSINIFAVSGTNLFAGTFSGVVLTTDFGANCLPVNSGLPNNCDIQSFAITKDNLFAGTGSNGVWRLPLSEVSVNKGQNTTNCSPTPVCIAVHPFSSYMSFSLPVKTGTLAIYDIHGRIMARIPVKDNSAIWRGNCTPGRYFAKVSAGKANIVKPFMIVK
jgi:photosystem II stability/assembly factor-like uncharacterized protein